MGFYIRKGFNFGPLRLNLSRSGLGASIGVTGARIGLGPRGTYVNLGRGGLYYHQTLTPRHQTYNSPSSVELREITSESAESFADSSAADLLSKLNLINRRFDLFPVIATVGIALLVLITLIGTDWLPWSIGCLAVIIVALCARHSDVTDGTLGLQYSFEGAAAETFSRLKNAMNKLAGCSGIWRVDAGGRTDDWKRNAGCNYIEKRSRTTVQFSLPPKVNANIAVPKIKMGRKSLYFFPDRLLIYDSSGVGAIPYDHLETQVGQTRFVETEYVTDATQVGTTWRYVNKNGGPDRRFTNNKQLPIMLYGEFSLSNCSGLNELFQCSVPAAAAEVSNTLTFLKQLTSSGSMHVSFTAPEKRKDWKRVALWAAVLVMSLTVLISLVSIPLSRTLLTPQGQALQAKFLQAQENKKRLNFAKDLEADLRGRHWKNASVFAANDTLALTLVNENIKAARRDGLRPLERNSFFSRVLHPSMESTLCEVGFRTISVTVNNNSTSELKLNCSVPK